MKELYWINGCEETELMLAGGWQAGSVNDAKNDALALRSGISGTNSSRRDTASQIEKISSDSFIFMDIIVTS